MIFLFAFSFGISLGVAKPLYEFERASERWVLDREKNVVTLAAEGATYVLPVDPCTKSDVDDLLDTLTENFRRLMKSEKDADARRLGTVTANGEKRDLRELAIRAYAPEYFAKLPARFVNLMITENGKCPRSFK